MAQDVSKSIWENLIDQTGSVGGVTTMRQSAENSFTNRVNGTDISRAGGLGLSASIPSTGANIGNNVDSSNLIAQLNTFLALYSKVRSYDFYLSITRWGSSCCSSSTSFQYSRDGYRAAEGGSSPPGGVYNNIGGGDLIDRSEYESIITTLNGTITAANNAFGGNVTFCHNSCHSNCHGARGRR